MGPITEHLLAGVVGVANAACSPAMLSISPNKMRQINDPIIELLEQLHRIILITQVRESRTVRKYITDVFSARCNIYISRLCHDASPSVRLSVTEVHWRIIANLGFKFRSHFTAHCGRRAAGGHRAARRAACRRIISRHASQC